MARNVVVSGGGNLLTVELNPPSDFIARQDGAFRRALEDLGELWARFEPIMSDIEQTVFFESGPGWEPLAESTARQKAREGWPAQIMVRTGRLEQSLIDPAAAADTAPMQMTWGTDVDYAHWHQTGGYKAGRPPQRKLIDIGVDERRRFERSMVGWINDVSARTWGQA
jgi:phage gpG-like protein